MKHLFLLLICATFFAGCKKADPQLPDATHVGAYTFGCKVDGVVFSASGNAKNDVDGLGTRFQWSNSAPFYISGKIGSPKSLMTLQFFYDGSKDYPLTGSYPNHAFYYDYSKVGYGPSTEFKSQDADPGTVNVEYDGKIISGTFSFNAINEEGTMVHITEGRFDIKQ